HLCQFFSYRVLLTQEKIALYGFCRASDALSRSRSRTPSPDPSQCVCVRITGYFERAVKGERLSSVGEFADNRQLRIARLFGAKSDDGVELSPITGPEGADRVLPGTTFCFCLGTIIDVHHVGPAKCRTF